MAPVVDGLEAQYKGQVSVKRINCESDYALAQKFGIGGVPTYVFLSRAGTVIERQLGGNPTALQQGFANAAKR